MGLACHRAGQLESLPGFRRVCPLAAWVRLRVKGGQMGLLRTVVLGRKQGLRAKLKSALCGGTCSTESAADVAHREDPVVAVGEQALSLGLEAPKDVTPPEGFEVVLHKDALKDGELVEIIIAGTAIAVAKFDGAFHAIDNRCPHAEGPLGEGKMDGPVVTCPYHGWEFDVRDGACLTDSDCSIQSFEVKVVGDAVCVAA
jgi:nitrite reductase (NADH) small subunit